MHSHRTRRRCLSALALCATLLGSPAVAAAANAPAFDDYVALGDSYTAGPLIPLQRLDPLGCFRSTGNYPALLADKLDVRHYTDVSCSGADTTNMTASQDVSFGHNAPQLNTLGAGTDLVTLGIGGNDFGVFGTLVGTCTKLREQDPTGSPCRDKFTRDGVDTLKARIDKTRTRIGNVLAAIHERAPDATVLAVGYPRIVPPTGYCPDRLPLADGDYAYADSIERALNDALRGAAGTDGDTRYVDTYTPSLGHDICATGGAAWINGKDTNLFAAAAYHPFSSGMRGEASIIYHQLGGTGEPPATGRVTAPVAGPQQLREAYQHH